MTNSKYIVIGGRGYIGSALFSSIPTHVIGLSTSSSNLIGFQRLRLDAPQDFDDLPIAKGDAVFLTAAISAPDICAREFERARRVNVNGTFAFITSAIERGARVIFFSSDTVYGKREVCFDENAACAPAGEYAEMKFEIEQCFLGNELFKSIRLSYVFSREDKFSRYLVRCSEQNEEAELFHPFFRSIVHRDDVVKGALALAERWDDVPEQIINFGGPQLLSRIAFAECLREACLHKLRFRVTEPDTDFFKNRPEVIAMKSPVFARLLGRTPNSLFEAARIEFDSFLYSELA